MLRWFSQNKLPLPKNPWCSTILCFINKMSASITYNGYIYYNVSSKDIYLSEVAANILTYYYGVLILFKIHF